MLAGRMKLRNFLLLVGGGLAAVIGVAYYYHASTSSDAASAARPVALLNDPGIDDRGITPRLPEPAPQTPAPTQAPEQPPPATISPGADLRPVDRDLLAWQGKSLGSDKKKDVTAGKPYKVNLYQDAGQSTMNRAKVDLDRDDKWDEKWTFDGTSISRKVAPADDENYTESYVWAGTSFVKQ